MSTAKFVKIKAIQDTIEDIMVYALHVCPEHLGRPLRMKFTPPYMLNFSFDRPCGCRVVIPESTWKKEQRRYYFAQRLEGNF